MKSDTEGQADSRGRVVDSNGRPLRDKDSRTYGRAAFQGRNGKPHPGTKRLEARQKAFDSSSKSGFHRPGSLKK